MAHYCEDRILPTSSLPISEDPLVSLEKAILAQVRNWGSIGRGLWGRSRPIIGKSDNMSLLCLDGILDDVNRAFQCMAPGRLKDYALKVVVGENADTSYAVNTLLASQAGECVQGEIVLVRGEEVLPFAQYVSSRGIAIERSPVVQAALKAKLPWVNYDSHRYLKDLQLTWEGLARFVRDTINFYESGEKIEDNSGLQGSFFNELADAPVNQEEMDRLADEREITTNINALYKDIKRGFASERIHRRFGANSPADIRSIEYLCGDFLNAVNFGIRLGKQRDGSYLKSNKGDISLRLVVAFECPSGIQNVTLCSSTEGRAEVGDIILEERDGGKVIGQKPICRYTGRSISLAEHGEWVRPGLGSIPEEKSPYGNNGTVTYKGFKIYVADAVVKYLVEKRQKTAQPLAQAAAVN